jgi:hypothetical protein
MKIAFLLFSLMLSLSILAETKSFRIETLAGAYVATDTSCHYPFAKIKLEEHADFKNGLLVEMRGSKGSGALAFHHFNIDEIGKTLKKMKNAETLKVRQLITQDKLSSETMGCLSGWLFCGPWNVDMIIEKMNDQTIRISQSKNEEGCTYTKLAITL